jgi:DNA-binding NtrC family response regulator
VKFWSQRSVLKIAKIIIVDDDKDIVQLFEQYLLIKGHEIIAKAYNGEEAIKAYKNLQVEPDIVFLDHRMPVKNGLETIGELRILNPEVKIIFISADYSVRNKALNLGVIDFIEKPIDFSTLSLLVEKHISVKNKSF